MVCIISRPYVHCLCASVHPKHGAGRMCPACRWTTVSLLQHHTCPVLCLDHITLDNGDPYPIHEHPCANQHGSATAIHSSRTLVFSGGTDGSVAVWCLTSREEAASGDALAAHAPVLTLEGFHQSGVNTMSVASTGRHQGGPGLSSLASEIILSSKVLLH